MRFAIEILTALAIGTLLHTSASGAPAEGPQGELILREAKGSGSGFEFSVIKRGFGDANPAVELVDGSGASMGALESRPARPINLWILVDSSTLCSANKIDSRVGRLAAGLPKLLPEGSLASVISYTNTSLEIHHNHRPLSELTTVAIRCEDKALSTSYEKGLKHLLETEQVSDLRPVVWVYTSGNVTLNDAVLAELKRRRAEVHVLLYSRFVAQEIRPIVARTAEVLGSENVRFTLLGSESPLVPERRERLYYAPPAERRGTKVQARLTAPMGDKAVQSRAFTLNIPEGTPLARYLRLATYVLLAALVAYLVYRVVKYYRPRHCGECGVRLRVSDAACLFCRRPGDAFLLGEFNLRDKHKVNRTDVVPLVGPVTEIGTHRRSAVPLVRPSRKRRACYVTIVKEAVAKDQFAFRLARTAPQEEVSVTVNGNPLVSERYLSSGDVISVADVEISFLAGRSSEESHVA